MFRNLVFCMILHLCQKVTSQAVDPPVMRVNNPGGSDDMSMKYSVSIRKYPQVIQPPVTASDAKTTSTKRDVNLIDGITTLSTYEENLLEPEEDFSSRNCAFTFTLPNPVPRNQQVCVTEVGDMMLPSRDDYDDYDNAVELNEMREEVSNIQESVLDIRNQMEQQTPQADLEPIKNEVEQLQEESRNTNSRLSQLFIQFLSEIIRARDDTIEFTQIENDVLNITVKYHELKDRHYDLVSNHEILKQKSNAQQDQIDYLQQQMEDMTEKMNRVVLKSEEAASWCRQIAAKQAKEERVNPANASLLPPVIQGLKSMVQSHQLK